LDSSSQNHAYQWLTRQKSFRRGSNSSGRSFDLEYADGVGTAGHLERRQAVFREIPHLPSLAVPESHQAVRKTDATENAKRQHIDLQQA